MAALSVTNSFVAGTSIVASQMNANFSDVVNWATGGPTISTSGQTTTVNGRLDVAEMIYSENVLYFNGNALTKQRIVFEGANTDGYETYVGILEPTAVNDINFPDKDGTVAMLSDIAGTEWNNADNILVNSVFS
jgi:hypothetical protein